MKKSALFIVCTILLASACVTPKCPECPKIACPPERYWLLDPYLMQFGQMAPLRFEPGCFDDPEKRLTDAEIMELFELTQEDFDKMMNDKTGGSV